MPQNLHSMACSSPQVHFQLVAEGATGTGVSSLEQLLDGSSRLLPVRLTLTLGLRETRRGVQSTCTASSELLDRTGRDMRRRASPPLDWLLLPLELMLSVALVMLDLRLAFWSLEMRCLDCAVASWGMAKLRRVRRGVANPLLKSESMSLLSVVVESMVCARRRVFLRELLLLPTVPLLTLPSGMVSGDSLFSLSLTAAKAGVESNSRSPTEVGKWLVARSKAAFKDLLV